MSLLLTDMLSERGFVTEAATNFEEAVLKARSTLHELAAAVVDLGLPDGMAMDWLGSFGPFGQTSPSS
ncbi:response regulator transcription factor [Bradyrhizobium sp. ARR65]|uniref:response regulator transcription factor n=1 Tax=Bradyrhizobium sp. ARR65 TaxID=1040989 RepID=UPI0004667E81|nr:response regulator transcription factor [Bradyrhizobium sp. ARR65]